MLLSKDIISNKELPSVIRNNDVFKNTSKFEKVFPHVGLNNFSSSIQKVKPTFSFLFKQSILGMKLNLIKSVSTSKKNNLLSIISYILFMTPTFFMELLISSYELFKYKSLNKNLKVTFSSDGIDGAWDIATMSMRGIASCQSWNSSHAEKLVGSIIDPCCAIMYLTDDEQTDLGSKMLHRVVVRYVIHPSIGPCIFMEQLYPYNDSDESKAMLNILFASKLNELSNLPVIYDFCRIANSISPKLYIPLTSVVDNNYDYASYRDSKLEYQGININHLKLFPSLQSLKKTVLNQ